MGGHFDALRLGCLEIDGELKLARLDHRKIGWLFALKYTGRIDACLAIHFFDVCGVAHQTTKIDERSAAFFAKRPAAISTEMPQPGYGKDGKRVLGEKAISPKPEGSSFGIRSLLAQTKLTFGINNIFDTRAPFSADWYQTYDVTEDNAIGRFFWCQIEKKF